ncbi:MAG: preprotein translocase subunit YajC [Brevinematales bacterium]|nr:preprotein translocase subunit YajC [Brevinematales bacterium]
MNFGLFMQAAPAGGAPAGGGMAQLLLLVGIFVVFYLVLILPENRRRKKLQKEINEMKIGDKVLLSGGIYGTVEFIGDKTIYVKSADAKIEVLKGSVVEVIKK